MPSKEGLPPGDRGGTPKDRRSGEPGSAAHGTERSGSGGLLEEVLRAPNLRAALKRVRKNRGSSGVDGMTVDALPEYLVTEWPRICEELLAGRYCPQPNLRRTIPKLGGGERELGIPAVLDRFLQQAILQVLQPRFDPTFSEHSHGFRPGRSAHGAIREACGHIQAGGRWVVDVDLEKFFDRVNHDVLMGRLSRRIQDRRLLVLLRRYLEAGVLDGGITRERSEGTPQGGPLSPLLANVLLDEVDQELERRGHRFVRYADDLRVFVASRRAGERVLGTLRGLLGRLRLRINEEKSAVAPALGRDFLGFRFWMGTGRKVRPTVSKKSRRRLKAKVRLLTRRVRGRAFAEVLSNVRQYLQGWRAYFRPGLTKRGLAGCDGWIRRRLRAYALKQWPRARAAYRGCRALGATNDAALMAAASVGRWWWGAGPPMSAALPTSFFDQAGIPRLVG